MPTIIIAQFNLEIAESLLKYCLQTLKKEYGEAFSPAIHRVPGAFEIPVIAAKCLEKKECDGVITLGAVIKGDTDHYEHVSRACADQLALLAVKHKKPVIYEVLSCHNLEQAVVRSSHDRNNKGIHAALAYIEMKKLVASLD